MNNIFEQYGIKDVANVTLYSIELDQNDDEIYIPVLYMDTLKVSNIEESTQSVSAQGGIGNPKLITWDYGKDITITLEDALFTPASNSMNWAANLGTKKLQLYLRHVFDRNIDYGNPSKCLRTATLNVDTFSDFITIPDRYPNYEKKENRCNKEHDGYAGGTSIYCWLVSGYILSDDSKIDIRYKDLLLFYREATQDWYFFNGRGATSESDSWYYTQYSPDNVKYSGIGYQYGKDTFAWVKQNIAKYKNDGLWTEYEKRAVDKVTSWNQPELGIDTESGVFFLTQNLYIDGYRTLCAKDTLYSELTEKELLGIVENEYIPYRYFANIGVEYNTNISMPQESVFSVKEGQKDTIFIEKMEKIKATKTFCVDTDVNMLHGEYRFINKYAQTPLTVFIDPRTMNPYLPNTHHFHRENGQEITGNLVIIEKDDMYYKWTRSKRIVNKAVGKRLVIDAIHYPGVYRLVGETTIRDRYGEDLQYQFEIPLCKLTPQNKFTLEADGDPTVFSMQLTALRRYDGVMMKLTAYDIAEERCPCAIKDYQVDNFTSPQRILKPIPYNGDIANIAE